MLFFFKVGCRRSFSSLFSLGGTTNAKELGLFYFLMGLMGGLVGFHLSFIIRMSLKYVGMFILGSETLYHTVLTAHAFTMIFFSVMPVLIGSAGNYLIPLMVLKSDMDLPRFNALAYWLGVPAFLFLLGSAFMGSGSATSWTVYPPLSDKVYHSSFSVDSAIFSLHLAGISSMVGSLNFMITAWNGGSVINLYLSFPLMVWCLTTTALLLILSLPVLAGGLTMLLIERNFSGSYFETSGGGDPVLFQHLFWFFGHPEVYILILPAFGAVSSGINWLSGSDVIFGYLGMVYAILSIGLLGCIVWVHHMFVVSMDTDSKFYFSGATMVIGVPTGMKVFTWLMTLMGTVFENFESVGVWIFGFICMFLMGGVTGVILSNASLDKSVHDSYFVVAHFHLVLSMGAVFGMFLFMFLWFPMFVGLSFSEIFALANFVTLFNSVLMIFLPMHTMGLVGHVRKITDSPMESQVYCLISSLGSDYSLWAVWGLSLVFLNFLMEPKVVLSNLGVSSEFLQGSMKEHTNSVSPVVFLN